MYLYLLYVDGVELLMNIDNTHYIFYMPLRIVLAFPFYKLFLSLAFLKSLAMYINI